MTFRDWQNIDDQIFTAINGSYHRPWVDTLFATFTDLHKIPLFAIVFVGLVLFFLIRKFGKQFWVVFLAMIVAASVSDLLCRRVLKQSIERPRPFQSETLKDSVVKIAPATGNSFPSNHTANCFAVAVIMAAAFPRQRYLFYIFAGLVAFSRVFCGVHYPSDVIVGSVVGIMIGAITRIFFAIQFRHSTPRV